MVNVGLLRLPRGRSPMPWRAVHGLVQFIDLHGQVWARLPDLRAEMKNRRPVFRGRWLRTQMILQVAEEGV